MARDGSSGVEKTFLIFSLPSSIQMQSVNVPPVSIETRRGSRAEFRRGARGMIRGQRIQQTSRKQSARRYGKRLFHPERVDAVEVVSRDRSYHRVSVALIEGQGRGVVHSGFEIDALRASGGQALLGSLHQRRAEAAATRASQNVDRDDVPVPASVAVRYDEAGDISLDLRHQRNRPRTPDVELQLPP